MLAPVARAWPTLAGFFVSGARVCFESVEDAVQSMFAFCGLDGHVCSRRSLGSFVLDAVCSSDCDTSSRNSFGQGSGYVPFKQNHKEGISEFARKAMVTSPRN